MVCDDVFSFCFVFPLLMSYFKNVFVRLLVTIQRICDRLEYSFPIWQLSVVYRRCRHRNLSHFHLFARSLKDSVKLDTKHPTGRIPFYEKMLKRCLEMHWQILQNLYYVFTSPLEPLPWANIIPMQTCLAHIVTLGDEDSKTIFIKISFP